MRELKFRAWDGENKEMIFSEECNCCVWDSKSSFNPVMQYTGLKDKNGKEIYEGDIVMCYPDERKISYQKVVKWANDRPELGITIDSSGLILCESSTKYIEIIGNIFENPEVLE